MSFDIMVRGFACGLALSHPDRILSGVAELEPHLQRHPDAVVIVRAADVGKLPSGLAEVGRLGLRVVCVKRSPP